MERDKQNNKKIVEKLIQEVEEKVINSKYLELLHEGNPPQEVPKKRLKNEEN